MLLYNIIKPISRIVLHFYARDIYINKKALLQSDGPLLLACNHPNSFLDAILLSSLFDKPIHSLARGDVFKKPLAAKFLRSLNMLPVYRTSEGVENLDENYRTFDACREVFKQNGIVLIFSEGLCINEWHLRRLKKGTARLALSSWEEGIPLTVLPLGLNFSSFSRFPKNVDILFGDAIMQEDISEEGEGKRVNEFNTKLFAALQPLVYELKDEKAVAEKFNKNKTRKNPLLALPALLGFILHYPLYKLVLNFGKKKVYGSGHFDSIMVGILFFAYPLYVVILTVIASFWLGCWNLGLLVVLPLLALSWVRWRDQVIEDF